MRIVPKFPETSALKSIGKWLPACRLILIECSSVLMIQTSKSKLLQAANGTEPSSTSRPKASARAGVNGNTQLARLRRLKHGGVRGNGTLEPGKTTSNVDAFATRTRGSHKPREPVAIAVRHTIILRYARSSLPGRRANCFDTSRQAAVRQKTATADSTSLSCGELSTIGIIMSRGPDNRRVRQRLHFRTVPTKIRTPMSTASLWMGQSAQKRGMDSPVCAAPMSCGSSVYTRG